MWLHNKSRIAIYLFKNRARNEKIMKSFDPNIVIFHYPNPYEATFLLPYLKKNIKFVLHCHIYVMRFELVFFTCFRAGGEL